MSDNGRLTLLFLCNLLFYFVLGELNHALSGWSVYLHLDIVWLAFSGLFLSRYMGLLYCIVLGLLADAVHPVPAGTYLLGYTALWGFLVVCRSRIRRQNATHVRTVSVIAQLLWFAALGLLLSGATIEHPAYWGRLLTDAGLSCLAVALLVWPWCVFQKKLLYSLGWDLEAQLARR